MMGTSEHFRLDAASLMMQHAFHQCDDNDADLDSSIAIAEQKAYGLKAKDVRNLLALTGGGKVDTLLLLWAASGLLPVVTLDDSGRPSEPLLWRGHDMIKAIQKYGMSKLYTPHFSVGFADAADEIQLERERLGEEGVTSTQWLASASS